MRLLLTVLVLPFFVISTNAQKKTLLDFLNEDDFIEEPQCLGIGMVQFVRDNYAGENITLYDPNGKPKIIVRATEDDVTNQHGEKTYSRYDSGNPLCPRLFLNNPDYFRLILDCNKVTDQYYQVIVNADKQEEALIRKDDPHFKFFTVTDYIRYWTDGSDVDFERTNNPLRRKPEDNALVVKHAKEKKYKIWRAETLELNGDWLKVKTVYDEVGWIRWRQGNRFLIRMYVTG